MGLVKCLLLAAVCMQVSTRPLSSQLSQEEEKVTRCIMEVLSESLSSSGPKRVSSSCIQILKEDERLISMLRHQHLLRELEDLTDQEKSQLDAERDSIEEEEIKKRTSETHIPPPKRDLKPKRGSENEESKEFEKIENVQVKEKEKEHGTSAEEKVNKLLEEEEDKRNAPAKRGSDASKRDGKEVRREDKKQFSNESDEDSSEEREHEQGHHGPLNGWYHRNHEGWEERKRGSLRRMAEDPSQEETAQFESEDRGMKYFNAKTHMHGFHGEDKRHVHHPDNAYYNDEENEMERHHYNGNYEHREEEEERELEEEREEHRAKERDIQEVEEELRKAAEQLEELHRG
ncbi:coiled-coil domain-containing glutamate-rich protein 2 isoform X1 [Bufo bufo]|uniref:coiled-coil domain-containing glutamate-rich protein 2 isoform X1 n=1 Tax=Bufo bufo TaxID=8384 RepID=UPI001ABE7955|nr:coiled-coil domain-containing glutamate-rich protein 2 isoform X1 [Bufo bufo]